MIGYLIFGYVVYAVGVTVGACTVGIGALVWHKYGKVAPR